MMVGSVVFGPSNLKPDCNSASGYSLGSSMQGSALDARACYCVGPQAGETKCPCALRSEAEQGRKMIQDGVIVNGKRYKLVEA